MEKREEACEEGTSRNLLSLPVELLVYIISFLPTIRDKVKLRHVSRRLRLVSETPSLWSDFVWPLYDWQEEHSVMNVLKACGNYIKHLIFPDYVPGQSTLIEMLKNCTTHGTSGDLRSSVKHRLEAIASDWWIEGTHGTRSSEMLF